jgi:methyltransferase (TIGR00027 family)
MSRRTAESTAEAFASLRAAGVLERDERVRGPDHLASKFIRPGPRLAAIVRVPLLRRLTARVAERVAPGAYFYELARVRHIDALILEAARGDLGQLVILGAGYDSRAHRLDRALDGVRIFEVDRPEASELKQERVRSIFGELPTHVTYVAADLDHDDLAEALAAGGYDPQARTLFVMSGLLMFLAAESVDGLLGFARDHSAPGSSIVFDYHYRAFIEGRRRDYHGGEQARRRAADMGEPFVFGVEEDGVGRFLEERGLELVSDAPPDELAGRYLVRSDGRPHGRPLAFIAVAHARVPEAVSRGDGRRARAGGDTRRA